MLTITFQNSLSNGKTWTFTDNTDYSGVTLAAQSINIWVPGQEPSTETAQIVHTGDVGSPNDPVEFTPSDFGKSDDTTLLDDGIYVIDVIVTSSDPDSPQTQRGYFLNIYNIRKCIAEWVERAEEKKCDCRDEDFDFIAKMNVMLDGLCFNYQRQNFTRVNSMLETLQNMCDDDSNCGC